MAESTKPSPFLTGQESAEVAQFITLSMMLTQAAIDLTSQSEIPEEVFAMMRQVRTTCAVLLAALQQVAAMSPSGFQPVSPMV